VIQQIENIHFLHPLSAMHCPRLSRNRAGISGVAEPALHLDRAFRLSVKKGIAAHAGQNVSAASDFMSGLRAALTGSGAAELTGVIIAFAFIRRDSLHVKT